MYYYVYILGNAEDNDLYKGFSENPIERLRQHNEGCANYTATKKDWQLLALFRFEHKREALIFEKKIKKWNRRSLDKLIASTNNIVDEFSVQ